jgi:solute carrier family 25 folate transporter 32
MVASVATYPHEVIRTRLQLQRRPLSHPPIPGTVNPTVHYRGILQTAVKVVQEETWLGLYKGLSINLLRTVPSSVVTMLT